MRLPLQYEMSEAKKRCLKMKTAKFGQNIFIFVDHPHLAAVGSFGFLHTSIEHV